MADFDVDGARKAGYSDQEIIGHLTQSRKFDAEGARKAGYSDAEIIDHLRSSEPKQKTSTLDKVRNVMITGSPKGNGDRGYHPDDPKNQFNFPPWLETVGNVAMLGEGAYGLYKAAPDLLKGGKAAIDFAKGALAPKATGRIAKGIESVKAAAEARLREDPTLGRIAKSADSPTQGKVKSQLLKSTPAKEPGGGPAKAPIKVTSNTRGGALPEEEAKSALETSAEGYKPSGKLKQQFLKNTPTRGDGGSGSYRSTPNTKAGKAVAPTEAAPASPSAISATPPPTANPIPQEVWDNMAPKDQQEMWAAYAKKTTAEPVKAPETKTSRTNRGTTEKQSTSDKIAERNRTTKALAEQHISDGQTSSKVLSMSPSERTAFMKQHGLNTNADYLAYVHNLLRLEGKGE